MIVDPQVERRIFLAGVDEERGATVMRIDECLRCNCAHAAAAVRAQRANGKEAARNRNAERAGWISCNDGPGHVSVMRTPQVAIANGILWTTGERKVYRVVG